MVEKLTAKDLIGYEERIKELWERGEIPYPVHFSGGNEEQLIKIFKRISPKDYVISTHRAHYHYILKGGSLEKLAETILSGKSIMSIFDRDLNFLSTAIVAGGVSIAAGISYAVKRRKGKENVWCFVGDGAEDEGHFYEAVRYVDGHNLPCKFIIEDNNRSVETPKKERYGISEIPWPSCVERYCYSPTFPHVGTGKFVSIKGNKSKGMM